MNFKQPVQKLTYEQKQNTISFLLDYIENTQRDKLFNLKQLLEIIPGETLNELINYLAKKGLNIKNIKTNSIFDLSLFITRFNSEEVPNFFEKQKKIKPTLKELNLKKYEMTPQEREDFNKKLKKEIDNSIRINKNISEIHNRFLRPERPPSPLRPQEVPRYPSPPRYQNAAVDPEVQEYLNILELSLDVLDLQPNELNAVIKKAYKRLSLQHHPDRGGNNEEFQKINNARDGLIRLFNLSGNGRRKIHKSPWIIYVKQVQKKYKCSYHDALVMASKTYHRR